MRFARVLGIALGFTVATAALIDARPSWAQYRALPANGKRATLSAVQFPFVVLGKERLRLAPGALIFDTNNRTVLPLALPGAADVVFTADQTGAVTQIYMLTPQERQALDKAGR